MEICGLIMSKFNSTRNKIAKLWETEQTNTNNVDNISKVNKDYESYNFKKRSRKITLVDDFRFFDDTSQYEIVYRLQNISESHLPFSIPIMTTRFEDNYDLDKLLIFTGFNYNFKKIADNSYDIQLFYRARSFLIVSDSFAPEIPIYVTINLYFLNGKNYFSTQTQGE